MRTISFAMLTFAILLANAFAGQAELTDKLKSGGHILMIRHALAPGGGDPPNFKIGDCSTQRNLNETGREQSRAIGKWLRNRGIQTARIYSSQWCRCLETANLLGLGPVKELPALNSFFERPQDRGPNLEALRQFMQDLPPDGALVILVTHFVTISAITGESVSSGEAVLIDVDHPDRAIGRLNFTN